MQIQKTLTRPAKVPCCHGRIKAVTPAKVRLRSIGRAAAAAAAVLLFLCDIAPASPSSDPGHGRGLLAVAGKGRNQAVAPKCDEIASSIECAGTKGCRWCRSDAVDYMCFSSAEAWRLPYQVFSCDG